MRYPTRASYQGLSDSLRARLGKGSGRTGSSFTGPAHACTVPAEPQSLRRSRCSLRGLLSAFGVCLGLLSMFACNGGWDGARGSTAGAPTIVVQPASQTVASGQTATFTVTATGTGPLTYQWYKNGTPISGATSSTYTTPTSGNQNGTVYTVAVTNAAGTVSSASATLTVNSPAANSLACNPSAPGYGATVTLVPTFSGGKAVLGSSGVGSSDITASAVSGSSYNSPAVTSAQTYTLTVTGAGTQTASTTCSVTPASVSISGISPANLTVAPGQQNFSATATGGATDGLVWTASQGTFNGSVWTAPTVPGTYTITATSVDNPSVSVTTTITVSLPVILTQPVSQNLCAGGTLILSVAADYADAYQWNLNGSPISGAISSTYSIPGAAPADDGSYTVTVTNPAGTVTSTAAKVVAGSSITSDPKSLSISATQTATFSVSAAGQTPFSYQWYVIPAGSSAGTLISGAISQTYTTAAVDITYNGAQYYAMVADSCGTELTSTDALLTVTVSNASPTITTEPTGQTVAVDGTATFTVVASGTPALAYQWYQIPAGSTTGVKITGATGASYTVPDTETAASNNQDQYYVVVSNTYGQAISQSVPLAVGDGIQITGQPVTAYVDDGASASFTVTAISNLPLTYQWYEASPGSSTFTAISGATSATYTLDSAASDETGSVFYAVVSNGMPSSVTSSSAALFVGPLSGVGDLCSSSWSAIANATPLSGCGYQLTAATNDQHGELVWPILIATGNIQLSFTVAVSDPSTLPADGFTVVLGDPSLGATPTSIGAVGMGLGAEGIPGLVVGVDTYHNPNEYPVPYIAVGRGETSLWEKPWFDVNTDIPAIASAGVTVTHSYTVSIVQGALSVTLDGNQILSSTVVPPPVAYLYVTSSTGGSYEQTVITNVSAVVSAP